MQINELIEHLKKIDLMEVSDSDRDEWMDALLEEFAYSVPSLFPEDTIRKIREISDHYHNIHNSTNGLTDVAYNQTRKWALKEQKLKEALDKKKLGHCYDLTGRFVMDNPDWQLVHGTITRKDNGYTINHAWAEKTETVGKYTIRKVYDAVWDTEMPWDAYERLLGAKALKRYTNDDMIHQCARQKHWGPWESINEEVNQHNYSNTQIKANKDIAEEVIKFGLDTPEEDLYIDPKDTQYGRELEPHITIKWGLTTNDPTEIENILDDSISPFQIVFGEVSMFSEDDKPYDVLKVDMDAGDHLEKLHDLFSELENEDSHPEYVPHMTVAYVKKGIGKKYVGDKHFVGLEMGVDCFEFKDQEGNSHQVVLGSNEDNFDTVGKDKK